MKREILDVRTFLTIILVSVSLMGQNWTDHSKSDSDAQNLNFIHAEGIDPDECLTSAAHLSLGEEYE